MTTAPGEQRAPRLDQQTVRVFLASLFAGVLYLFGSLAVLVTTTHTYCEHRAGILLFALVGAALVLLTLRNALVRRGSSRIAFILPAVFFLLGTGIPWWLLAEAAKVCAVRAGG